MSKEYGCYILHTPEDAEYKYFIDAIETSLIEFSIRYDYWRDDIAYKVTLAQAIEYSQFNLFIYAPNDEFFNDLGSSIRMSAEAFHNPSNIHLVAAALMMQYLGKLHALTAAQGEEWKK